LPKTAIVLSSGGLDSTTVMALAREDGFDLVSLSFDYNQRHHFELNAADQVAKLFQVKKHVNFPVDLSRFGGSALTTDIPVPMDREDAAHLDSIPITYVPARNTVFLSIALALAETESSRDIYIGVNALDYSGYPDCRPEYIESFEKMANLATRDGVTGNKITIHAPLVHMTKAQIILEGQRLGVDYSITHSCYNPNNTGVACGHCDSCILRQKGFQEAGFPDPISYQ
jgi:7-cyano-7-deazaguanine synthase